jgi:hypothetical protein
MARFIFIFSNILVYFLTIVSTSAFPEIKLSEKHNAKIESFAGNDTIVLEDNFETGTLQNWKQTSDWEVSSAEKISGAYSLKHSTKAVAGNSFTFHQAKADLKTLDLEWKFALKNGNWDPSSSNRFWFYLCADTTKTDLINGFAVGVNISGSSDLLELWCIRNGKADSLIVESDLDWNASTLANINVKRTAKGVWSLQYQKTGEAKSNVFSGVDATTFSYTNIGLLFNFTATRAGQLWFDDLLVTKHPAQLFVEKLNLIDAHTIRLTFNNPVAASSIRTSSFSLTDEAKQPVEITKATLTSADNRSVDVTFGKTTGSELSLKVSGIADLSGKAMQPDVLSFSYALSPEKGSVLINEVLFNPLPGGSDFVELVNVSGVPVALTQLKLATRNDLGELKQIYPVSSGKRVLQPGEYLVCTKDPAAVMAQYATNNPASFVAMSSFPSFSDDAGSVVLLNASQEVIDEFSYTAKMHSPFLGDEEGVSLERISLEKPTADGTNWQSAAESAGFATPGLPNSQTRNEALAKSEITCEPEAFSPNGDGYNDELSIRFRLDKPGYIANMRIFDAVGRLVTHLIKNQSLAQDGSWTWDGKNQAGQKQSIGVYIVLVELFDSEGHQKMFKKTCTLTDRTE